MFYLCGWSALGDSKFIFGLYGGTAGLYAQFAGLCDGTADEHLDESLLILCVAFNLLSLN